LNGLESGKKELVTPKPIKAGCSKCDKGTIYIPQKEGLGVTFKYCDCYIEAESYNRSKKLFQKSNIRPEALLATDFSKWIAPEGVCFEDLVTFIDNKTYQDKWIFLYGGTGSGKTLYALLLCQIALYREQSVCFAPVAKLLEALRPSNDNAYQVLQRCLNVDVLVLDDIGHEKTSQWVKERLYIIINDRWDSKKTTVFTSNFPVENLKTSISNAVYSRVKGEAFELHLDSMSDKRLTQKS